MGRPGALRAASMLWRAARRSPAEVTGETSGGAGQKGLVDAWRFLKPLVPFLAVFSPFVAALSAAYEPSDGV